MLTHINIVLKRECVSAFRPKKIMLFITFFCPLRKIFLGNPYLKILDPSTLFVVDAPMKKKKMVLFTEPFEIWSENRPYLRGLMYNVIGQTDYKGNIFLKEAF